MLRNIRNVFERAELTRQEVQTLFGVIESLHRIEPAVRDGDSFAVIFDLIKAMICMDMGPWRMPWSQPPASNLIAGCVGPNPRRRGHNGKLLGPSAAIKAWGEQHAHKVAQEKGNTQWYRDWVLSTARLQSAANQRLTRADRGAKVSIWQP